MSYFLMGSSQWPLHAAKPSRCKIALNKVSQFSQYGNLSGASVFIYSNLRAALRLGNTRLLLRFLAGLPKLHAAIDPKALILFEPQVFTSKIREMVWRKDFFATLERFEKALERERVEAGGPVLRVMADGKKYFQSAKPQTAPKKNVWDLALEVNEGNREAALDFMMLFVQDQVAEQNGIVADLASGGTPVGAQQIWDHIQRVGQKVRDMNSDSHFFSGGEKSFTSPDGQSPPQELDYAYHFWSAAYLAKELIKQGVEPNMARYLALLNGDSYEKALYLTEYSPVFNYFLKEKRTGVETTVVHPLNHIAMHVRGAFFGSEPDAALLPSHQDTYDFVRNNMWNHYRAIAYGDFSPSNPKSPEPKSKSQWKVAIREIGREKFLWVIASLGIAMNQSWEKCWCVEVPLSSFELRYNNKRGKTQVLERYESETSCQEKIPTLNECR